MKKNGHFWIFDLLMQVATPCRFAEEGEGGGAEPNAADTIFGPSDPIDNGNPEDPATADDATPDAEEQAAGEADDEPQEPSDEEQLLDVDDDELSEALKGKESDEQKMERIKREYAASSTEAKRLNSELKALKGTLDKQGLKIVSGKDGIELVPTEKYSDKAPVMEMDVSKLSVYDVEALESGDLQEIQEVVNKLLKKQASTLVRPTPTLEKEPPSISDERKASVFEQMAEAKNVDDSLKHDNLEKNRPHIEAEIKDKNLEAAFAEQPEYIAGLVNMRINDLRAQLIAKKQAALKAAKKKESEGAELSKTGVQSPSGPSGYGSNSSALDAVFGK